MKRQRLRVCALVLLIVTAGFVVFACLTYSRVDAGEQAFITGIRASLMQRFGTVTQAEGAGYMQMTELGSDGTSIYFNHRFDHVDPLHPNFLWYDHHGKLVGLDYEFPVATYTQPPGRDQFPVGHARWATVSEHVHFAYEKGGEVVLEEGDAQANLRTARITAATLVRDNLLPPRSKLVWFSYHPTCWDLGFWLIPNPLGPFADYDPEVYF